MSYTLITGATGGLGAELTKQLLSPSQKLVLVGRNQNKLDELQALSPILIETRVVDLTVGKDVEATFQQLIKDKGVPTQLINCAGSGLFGQLAALEYSAIEQTITNNLLSVVNPCKALFESMKTAGGTIINVMSTAALKGKAGESVYCAAKWGVRGFTESLREEAKGSKLRIVSVYPAGMNTPFWDSSDVAYPTESFMSAADAASMIASALPQVEKGYISEISLSR